MDEQQNRQHRKPKVKKERAPGTPNPKAHAFANPGRFARQAGRTHDVKEKRLHVPLVDRLPEEAPPLIVGVVGPPGVGKTTLIKSLIRRYTKQTLSIPTGPLTVVTSKRRRLTFIESPADSLASMIDVAKVVDIVLLMIDGSYGFEMETMEFLNILSSSGMPGNVFGILTKLDFFKKQDTLRTRKKQLKHRFWSELYQGAKLFYLSGVVNGRYPDREILNLSRFLAVMKNPRPLVWRNSHPYCLADRFLDVTAPTDIEKDPKCDRQIALYGYLRGTNFAAQGARVHIPGVGDLNVSKIESLPDPCPTPFMDQAVANATGKSVRRRLGEKQKVLFAPMSDVGGVLIDKDAVYIDVKKPTFDPDADYEQRGFGEQLVVGLQGDRRLLGAADAGVRLFEDGTLAAEVGDDFDLSRRQSKRRPVDGSGGIARDEATEDEAYVSGSDMESQADDSDVLGSSAEEDFNDLKPRELSQTATKDHDHGEVEFADSDSDIGSLSSAGGEDMDDEDSDEDEDVLDDDVEDVLDDEEEVDLTWKDGLAAKARAMHGGISRRRTADLVRLIYNLELTPNDVIDKWNGKEKGNATQFRNGAGEDDDFFKHKPKEHDDEDDDDRTLPQYNDAELESKWTDHENQRALRSRFVNARTTDGEGDEEDDDFDDGASALDGDEDEDGGFEDLEAEDNDQNTKQKPESSIEEEREKNARKKEELKMRFEHEDREGFANDKNKGRQDGTNGDANEFGEDEWYDAQKAKMQKQLDINRAEFEGMDESSRINVEGLKAGTYARILLENVPYEFASNFNPRYPIIVGGLNPTEDRFGYVQVRIKRHRWHQKILKNNDPLIFSLGWRRFQTVPVYSISDSRTRNRMLKYTPEHMHCFGTFYGPLIAPNTGFCCVQSFSNKNAGFRIAATGVVLNVDESTEIVKKLKLKGFPHKIFKNTAIIRDMFATELEVMKFKAGNVRTVSGVRGMIKGRAGNQYPDGYVRVGFEDKILKSDIVFLSTWRFVKPREFYMPVTNLLLPPGAELDASTWQGMRLTGQVRQDQNLPTPHDRNSLYRPIERPERHFNPLRVPRKLASDLPFKSQIAQMKPRKNQTYMQKRAVVLGGEEKRARDLMQKLLTLRNEKVAKRAVAQKKRKEPYLRRMADDLEKKTAREKRERDEYWKREGKKRRTTDDGEGGDGGGKGKFKRTKR